MDNNLKRFIDRADFITDFKQQCNDLQNEPDKIKVISYYGYGGLGKTALLQHLMESQNKINGFDYIYHDFDSIVDMRGVLKKLKRRLSKIGCEFPLFEMGNYLYEISIGENSLPPQNKSFLSDYPFISNVLNLSLATFTMASSGGVAAAFAAADVAQKAQPVMEEIFDTVLKKLNIPTSNSSQMAHRIKVRKYIEELKKQGENRPENQLENDLPKLFAQDFSYWTANQNKKIVIFLDSYDILKNKGRKTKEHPEPDWWLKGEDEFALGGAIQGLLLSIPNIVWVLSGRNELQFEGYLREKLHQKELQPFNNIYSLQFLQSRGITNNDELCAKITKLTQGYPLYLELCGQQYRMLKKKDKYHEPEISDFGAENEAFSSRVGKIILNLIECMDDTGIREMIKYLCALKIWFDDMAWNVIPIFNETAYNILKNYSFVRSAKYDDELNINTFYFDNTVQEILLNKYKKENPFVINRSILNMNKYFDSSIKKFSRDYERCSYFYRIWSDIIYRLVDDVDELQNIYEEYFEKRIYLRSEHSVDYNFRQEAENVTQKFFQKVRKLLKSDSENSFVYAYFELVLGYLKNFQNKYIAASEYLESAYKKFVDLNSDGEYKILVLNILSESYNGQGLNKKQIEVHYKIVDYTKKYYPRDCEKQLKSIDNLLEILSENNLREDALTVREEAIEVCKDFYGYDGEKTLEKMGELADEWGNFGKYDKALEIRKRILNIVNQQEDNFALIEANKEIADLYHHAQDYENEIKFYEKVLELCEKEYGKDSHELIKTLCKLSDTLEMTDNIAKRQKVHERIAKIYKNEIDEKISLFGENSEEVVDKIAEFANILYEINFDEESLHWVEKKADIQKKIIEELSRSKGKTHKKTIEAIKNLEWTLNNLEKYDEQIELYKNLIRDLEEDNSEGSREKFIDALKTYVILLNDKTHSLNCFENAKERFEVLNSAYEKLINLFQNQSDEKKLLIEMERWANACQNWNNYEKALAIRQKIVEQMKSLGYDETDDSFKFNKFLYALSDSAKSLRSLYKVYEEFQIRHKIIAYLKKWLEKHFELDMFEEFVQASTGLAERYHKLRTHRRPSRKKDNTNVTSSVPEENKELNCRKKFLKDLQELFSIHSEMEIANKIIYAATDLINLYCKLKDFDNALKINEEILKFAKTNFGDYAEETIEAMYNTGDIYFESGNITEFEKCYKNIIETLKKQRGEENFEHIVALKNLAFKYETLKRYDNAIVLFLQIVDTYKKFHNEGILQFIEAHSRLADLYEMKGDFENALTYREKVIEMYNKNWGKKAVNSIDSISSKADTLEKFEKYSDAVELRKEVAKIYNLKKKKSNNDDFDELLAEAFEKLIELLKKIESPEIKKWQQKLDSLENNEYNVDDLDLILEISDEE